MFSAEAAEAAINPAQTNAVDCRAFFGIIFIFFSFLVRFTKLLVNG
jgi:hypothetical protein